MPPLAYRNLNDELRASWSEKESETVLGLLVRHSLWIDPEIVRQAPKPVFPLTIRKTGVDGQGVGTTKGNLVRWANEPPAWAFWAAYSSSPAVGVSPVRYRDAWVSHLYGGVGVKDPMHYSRLENLVAVPASLNALTDWEPIQRVLRWRAYLRYGYTGPADRVPEDAGVLDEHWPGDQEVGPNQVEAVVLKLKRKSEAQPDYRPARSRTAPIPA